MSRLSDFEKELIFDYCLGVIAEENQKLVTSLISDNDEARELYGAIKSNLSPLDILEDQACPDYLVEHTMERIENSTSSSHIKLQQLLEDEQVTETKTVRFWPNMSQVITTAAVLFFVATVFFPTVKYMRECSWKNKCNWQLSQIANGLNSYSADYNDELPSVAKVNGQPWWKVSCNGQDNCSNTRNAWLLVKNGYVQPENFVCPGVGKLKNPKFETLQVKQYNDFPERNHITYSTRLTTKRDKIISLKHTPLFADSNPLFEKLPQNNSKLLKLIVNKKLQTINSINHNRKGQNVLFNDSSVRYTTDRNIGPDKDDIFTLQNTQVYNGYEVPVSESDSFLAP